LYISEKAPAKINLTLDALYKRADGYHELEMVMTTIDLADRIDLMRKERPTISLESSSGLVPQDERNLAYRAAALLKGKMGVERGVHIYIHKRIPVAAGLAGGSSDAAATLRGLNRLWELGLTDAELAKMGAEIGSDVPFCVYSNTALAKGRGEILTPLLPPPACWVVLAKPTRGVSTADVFGNLEIDQVEEHPDTEGMVQAIEAQDYVTIQQKLINILEPVTMKMYPEVRRIKEKMMQFGADGVLMSGSGPVVYGLVEKEYRAKRMMNGLKGFCQQVFAVRMLGIRHEPTLDENRTK
jgi:4-diphosphocytidyl-2-C-methyl-D-erythritol kinase